MDSGMQKSILGHTVSPGIAEAVALAKRQFELHGHVNYTTIQSQWSLTEEEQLDVIECFGAMFGERIRTTYSNKELREWIQTAASKIIRLLAEELALQEIQYTR